MAYWCPSEDTLVCSFCPGGLSNPNLVLPTDNGTTCAMALTYASSITEIDPDCTTLILADALCCAPIYPCIICPNCATVGDDFVPNASINEATCAELIDAAKQNGTGSDWCAISEIQELYCCPSEPEESLHHLPQRRHCW